MPTIELYPIPWGQEPPAHLRQIYEEAFPPEERRPWTQLFGPERCEHIAQLILSDDEVVGFVVGWELPSSHYFEYLVIDPCQRGQGLAFYARFGLTVQPFDYRQPPYGADLPWVDLHLLSNCSLQEADFLRIQQEIHRQVYRISSDK